MPPVAVSHVAAEGGDLDMAARLGLTQNFDRYQHHAELRPNSAGLGENLHHLLRRG